MKITNVSKINRYGIYYTLTYYPNWFERLLGFKEKDVLIREEFGYKFFNGVAYFYQNGNQVKPSSKAHRELNRYHNKFH